MNKQTDIDVKLIGENGNAYFILGKVSSALIQGGHSELAETYLEEAMGGDYSNLLYVTSEYVNIV
jgi:hypothetical protein